jgi:hypothetical protein
MAHLISSIDHNPEISQQPVRKAAIVVRGHHCDCAMTVMQSKKIEKKKSKVEKREEL